MIKVYRIEGFFGERGSRQPFAIDLRATKPEEASEKAYADIGSRHKCKRREVKIESVKEIPAEESKSLLARQISEEE